MRLVFSVLACISFAGSASANDGPSYEQTVNFILEKTAFHEERFDGRPPYRALRTVSFPEQCVMVLGHRALASSGGRLLDESSTKLQLNLVDPSTIKAGKYSISLESTGAREVFSYKGRSPDQNGGKWIRFPTAGASIYVTQYSRNASKVVRAIQHLVNLCGGKKELF